MISQLSVVELMLMKLRLGPAFIGWRPVLLHAALQQSGFIEMNAFCAFHRRGANVGLNRGHTDEDCVKYFT